ncbi:MAG: DUF1043 family protein [Porticoccaceae bacterium]|nr:DUF1043 family protein [Porticoccaceae bacterium]
MALLTTLIIAVIAFLAGAGATFFYLRHLEDNESGTGDLQRKLEKSEQRLKRYQQEVSEHFIAVSHLTTNVAQSYRQIHEHLATSAIRLASPEIGRQLLKSGGSSLSLVDADGNPLVSAEDLEAPRDYAPKVPGGILSEAYGLVDGDDETDAFTEDSESTDEESRDPTEIIS